MEGRNRSPGMGLRQNGKGGLNRRISNKEPQNSECLLEGLLDPNHHGVGSHQVFDARLRKSHFFHPGRAVRTGVVEAARGFDQHVQTQHEAKGIAAAIVIDDGLVHDDGPAGREGVVSPPEQEHFLLQVPVVQDMPIHHHVGLGKRLLIGISGGHPVPET